MARQLVQYVKLIDDLDGTEGDEATIDTVEIGLDGVLYELDLTHANIKQLRKTLDPYIKAAHSRKKLPKRGSYRATTAPRGRKVATIQKDRDARLAIREWARKNGFSVGSRGSIHPDAIRAFRKANPDAYIPSSTLGYAKE